MVGFGIRLIFVLFSVILNTPISVASSISSFIYNGEETTTGTDGDWPSIASLYYDAIDYSGTYGLYCGASILDNEHVLTAAHCLFDGNGSLNEEYLVYTSVVPQMENEQEFIDATVQIIRASEFYVHSDYDDTSYNDDTSWPNDIAVIKLVETMNISDADYITRATGTQSVEYRSIGEKFVAVGHGLTESGDEEELLQTTLTYNTANLCSFDNISESQLCMSGEENDDTGVNNSTCSGDSGGPLYWYDDSNAKYVQAGITSYGWTSCYNATTNDTSVFTEVSDYENWISEVLAGEVTPDYTITGDQRDAYEINDDETSEPNSTVSTTSSSGGSVPVGSLIFLALIALKRKIKVVADTNFDAMQYSIAYENIEKIEALLPYLQPS
ncbi:serine protease [Vibrio sp. DW001]|uniref:S1 family peptidase n=1 Tax=Vibrio sp. DW001 TaxID=2912315 RepID=UPI0023AEB245|nr:serine protease [Vibrio sp. DW001]WED27760.1 serine protease [Vibrio sp. DW001]